MKRLAGVLVLTVMLTGCGEKKLDHGQIVGKVHEPASEYVIFIPLQMGSICSGNPVTCTPIYVPFPFYFYDGEDFKLKLEDGKKHGVAYVDRATFDREQIDTYYDVRKVGGQLADTNNHKRRKHEDGGGT